MEKRRLVWIDYAKAIGIFMVILGHVPVSADIKWAMYGVHMPLFFIISGLLRSRTEGDVLAQLKKIVNGLIIPYVIYALCITALYCVVKPGETSFLIRNVVLANYAELVGDFTTLCPLWFIVSLASIKLIDLVVKNTPPCCGLSC